MIDFVTCVNISVFLHLKANSLRTHLLQANPLKNKLKIKIENKSRKKSINSTSKWKNCTKKNFHLKYLNQMQWSEVKKIKEIIHRKNKKKNQQIQNGCKFSLYIYVYLGNYFVLNL